MHLWYQDYKDYGQVQLTRLRVADCWASLRSDCLNRTATWPLDFNQQQYVHGPIRASTSPFETRWGRPESAFSLLEPRVESTQDSKRKGHPMSLLVRGGSD